MSLGMHPFIVDFRRGGSNGDILFDQVEVRARKTGPLRNIQLARILMCDRPLGDHAQSMLARCFGKRAVPAQWWRTCSRSGLIGQRHQLLCIRSKIPALLRACLDQGKGA